MHEVVTINAWSVAVVSKNSEEDNWDYIDVASVWATSGDHAIEKAMTKWKKDHPERIYSDKPVAVEVLGTKYRIKASKINNEWQDENPNAD